MPNNSRDDMTTTMELLNNTTPIKKNAHLPRSTESFSVHKVQQSTTATTRYNTFHQRLNKTQKKIQKHRQDAKGYMNIAKLYSDQGKQSNAIPALQQSFQFFSTTDRQVIQQQSDLVKSQLEQRVDFISQYPYEIICHITQYLDQQTIADCLDVSPSWRSKLLGCSTLWKRVVINEMKVPNNGLKHKRIVRILPFVSKHVQDLKITSRMNRTTTHPIELLAKSSFPNLKSLTLDDYGKI
ncbi:hypothetical protein BDA99DRAFT_257309 [Phascolomyces articulosus]|uniref:F-box domain-containing protein n=1 Tax=Phascolomyces articulosus TaxID=60185 RepID=A0AAD5K1R1_9FUNG|nr:hypothetical protein BDA99DRAFT_257309 [Phascolomyces articulosus]